MERGGRWLTLGLVAAALGTIGAGGGGPQGATVDLETLGMPKDTFHADALMHCPNDLLTYRAVEWLNAGTVLAAFTVSPLCPKTMAPAVNAMLKLATFDTEGKMLHAVSVPYLAGLNNAPPNDGVWTLADGRVVVEFPPNLWTSGPMAGGVLEVWSAELKPLQTVELHGERTDALHAAGVSADGKRMVMGRGMNERTDAQCVELGGDPLAETGACTQAELEAVEARAHDAGGFPVPKGEEAMMFPGAARDGSRASTFLTKQETVECRMQGQDCPTSGEFVVFDAKSKAESVKMKVSVLGRMALAPDGKHAAVMDKDRLEIVAIP